MTNNTYVVGFSTNTPQAANRHQWKLYNVDIVLADLVNHFNTRFGERLGRPTFGCRIWQYLMEQRTDAVVSSIKSEIQRVCDFDGRVTFQSCTLVEVDHGIIATVVLLNNITQGMVNFVVNFDERQGYATRG